MYVSVDDLILLFLLQVPLNPPFRIRRHLRRVNFHWSSAGLRRHGNLHLAPLRRWASRPRQETCGKTGEIQQKSWDPVQHTGIWNVKGMGVMPLNGLVVFGISTGKPGKQKHKILGCSMVFVRISINLIPVSRLKSTKTAMFNKVMVLKWMVFHWLVAQTRKQFLY